MPEENARFLFTFSAEATAELMAGNVSLSSGGLRKPDGSMLELAKPVVIDPADVAKISNRSMEEQLEIQVKASNSKLDQIITGNQELKKIAWMNYAVNCRTYEMTYQGFQAVIQRLDDLSAQFSDFQIRLNNKEFNDTLELNNKHKNNLQTIAGVMETKNFNAGMSTLMIEPMLNEIQAYFERLYSELKSGVKADQLVLGSIIFLLEPYCYVVRRYSALYYYENEVYPANYQTWTDVISRIVRDSKFRNRMKYYLRLNSDLTLEDVLIAKDKALFDLRGAISQIDFDKKYVLCHSKEQYLSIEKQLQDKIASGDYQLLDDHLCVEL
jgi:hypothetical protein